MALTVRRSNGNATTEVSRQQPLADLDRLNLDPPNDHAEAVRVSA